MLNKDILVPEFNGNQNPNESYTNKYQKHVAFSYNFKSACADDKFCKPFKSYLGENAIYNFISGLSEVSKYCKDVMKKHFNNKLAMTKEDNEDFENSAKCVICDNDYIDADIKVRYHCHVTGKYRGSVHTDCNVNVKLYHKIPVEFHNLKKYDSHLTMQELGKFNPKISFFIKWIGKVYEL